MSKVKVEQKTVNLLMGKLSSYFGVKKDTIRAEQEALGMPNIVYSESVKDVMDESVAFYCIELSGLALEDFFVYRRFIKSEIYAQFLNGKAMAEQYGNFVLYLHFNNINWVVYEQSHYNGFGGIFVRSDDNGDDGFVIEPIDHYLKAYWPKNVDD